jgi:hypothetical protein
VMTATSHQSAFLFHGPLGEPTRETWPDRQASQFISTATTTHNHPHTHTAMVPAPLRERPR